MNYTDKTESYNERRYGKPWMAVITTSTTKDFSFIDWEGRPGRRGEFSFFAEPGTIVAYGQKDLRKGRGGVDGYQICMPDGWMPTITDATARVLRKLPVSERPAACAAICIRAKESKIAEYEPKAGDYSYYVGEIEELRSGIEQWKAYLPAEVHEAEAVDMAAFGF